MNDLHHHHHPLLPPSHLSLLLLLPLLLLPPPLLSSTDSSDMLVLQTLLQSVSDPSPLGWTGSDACGSKWKHIKCVGSSVTELQFSSLGLSGHLPSNFNQLNNLQVIALQGNSFSGPLPSFNGLSNLQDAFLGGNQFDSIPSDFFRNLTKLSTINLEDNPLNKSTGWILPTDLASSTSLSELSLTNTSLTGTIPDFLGNMRNLQILRLAYNTLSGSIPATFDGANLVEFQVNNQLGTPRLSGTIDVVGSMESLTQLWLQVNDFSGTIPDNLGSLVSLKDCRLNDNSLVGLIPHTISQVASLVYFSVKNNLLDGPLPRIPSIRVNDNYTYNPGNYFCVDKVGVDCSPEVNVLLSFLGGVGYPSKFVAAWAGNNPCSWDGVTCDAKGVSVTAINLPNSHLTGIISPALANLTTLKTLVLSGNNLTGTVPSSLTSLQSLTTLDIRNNNLYGPLPSFSSAVSVLTTGNANINSTLPPTAAPSSPNSPVSSNPANSANAPVGSGNASSPIPSRVDVPRSSPSVGAIVGAVLGVVSFLFVVGVVAFIIFKRRGQKFQQVQTRPNTVIPHAPGASNNEDVFKVTIGNSATNGMASEVRSHGHNGPSEMQVMEVGNLTVSIEVLRQVTNNFSDENILGKGGFGVVYRGELQDGTKIAVKRMEAAVVSNKGLQEFQAEIAVLTKVRHRHLVALLGYCIEGNERLLVYEYMPLGTLSQHLFEWAKLGVPPLNWKRRLIIALDVARGMEYLHGLAHKSFIHRDLKPSNILLGDDYRAKVSDFGLVKLAPDEKFSVETRLAGTFGYLAPEYAVTGRVTTKADVFSFGVVLMELITGRKALDETQPEESMHLVTWFRRISCNKEAFMKAIDRVLEVTDESFQSICTVAELAGHCTAREPNQRPDMGHAVNVLSSIVEQWKPTDTDEEGGGIDADMTLPQALQKWQEASGDSSSFTDFHSSIASIPTRSTWLAESFTSTDGR